jgi:polysaccharide biosynthesis transport protein
LNNSRNLPVLSASRPDSSQDTMPAIDVDGGSPGISMTQLLTIVRAYRRQTIAIVAVVVVVTFGIIKVMPKTYASTATLMVNYESNDPLMAGAFATGPIATFISTEIELMQSSEVLLPVVDKLNLTANSDYNSGFKAGNGNLRDWVKDALVTDLEIFQGRLGSQLIYINASAADPVLAASIANAVADTYLEQQSQRVSGPASDRAKNYAKQLSELKEKVAAAQAQVTAFRQQSHSTDVDSTVGQANTEATLLASLELKYQEAQNARRSAEVAASGDRQNNKAVASSMIVQSLKTQLATQETKLAELRATLGPAHPKVTELENQITATRKSLNEEVSANDHNAESDLVAARQLEQKLAQAVEEQRAKVLAVSKLQDEGTKYMLELESAQAVYKRALDGYDQIMFASGVHNANVSFVSRAVPVVKAVKPAKPKLFAIGIVAGLLIGLGGPLVYEIAFNRRVRCRDDFERAFGVPVLSEFDAIAIAPSAA